jgi:gamma-glutamyl-gamma-aminobutyrate hydrolase PuuD
MMANDENLKKMKGVSFRLNDNIELESYKNCLEQFSVPIMGIYRGSWLLNLILTPTPDIWISKNKKKQ